MLKRHKGRGPQLVGVLDIGSSKVCCLIAERTFEADAGGPSGVRVLGIGHQQSRGIKAGFVTDLEQADTVISHAIGQAEDRAGVRLDEVVVNISCGRMRSVHFTARGDIKSGYVSEQDQARLADNAYTYAERGGRSAVLMNRLGYLIDGSPSVRNPLRMAGREISAQYHAVTVDEAPLENLMLLLERSFLSVRQFVPTGLASALAVTTENERRMGVISIDIGAGATNIAMIADGRFLFTDVLPVGGAHLTYDLARVLSTSLAESERIKTLYGTVVAARSDERDVVSYARAGERDADQVQTTKLELRRILYPRVVEQMRLLRERIETSDIARFVEGGVVLTGGGAQLVGLPDVAGEILERPVRFGHTRISQGMPEALESPAFAAAAGMIEAAGSQQEIPSARRRNEAIAGNSYLVRMTDWVRENF